jgi:limonene-1,2-epoxide hydrolase
MSARQTVEDFLNAWSTSTDAMRQSYRDYFTETTVWENVGMSKTVGPDAALALIQQFEQGMDMGTIVVDMLNIAVDGDRVLTERIDRIIGNDGSEKMAIRLMGIFEIEEGKITRWSDYFDTAPFTAGK